MTWTNSLGDIETRTRLKVGNHQALLVQDYQTLVSIMSQILGGEPQSGGRPASPEPEGFRPKNVEEMTMAFNSVLGNGR